MNETLIPWDFLLLILIILILMVAVIFARTAWLAYRRTRLTSPRKDYINRSQSPQNVRE